MKLPGHKDVYMWTKFFSKIYHIEGDRWIWNILLQNHL